MSTLLGTPTPQSRKDQVTPIKVVAAALMLAVGVAILAHTMDGADAAKRDYMCYWAAAQQMAHGKNPSGTRGAGDTTSRRKSAALRQSVHALFPPASSFFVPTMHVT